MSRRRGNHEGSLYFHKPSGKWTAQITIQGRRLTKYFDTQKAGREWMLEIRNQLDKGLTFQAAQLSLDDYFEQWLEMTKDTIKQTTWIDYRQGIRNHISPYLGKTKIKDLKPADIQFLINQKKEAGLSAWRLQFIKRILNKALRQAVVLGIIPYNPVKGVTVPRPPKKEMKVWNKDQVRVFLAHVEGHRLEALYYLAITTGLRQGELLGLKWDDLDEDKNRLHIKRQLRRVREKGLVFGNLKTEKSRRVIVLSTNVVNKLAAHRQNQKKEFLFTSDRWQNNDLIFPSTIGTPLEPRNLYRHFANTSKEIGLPKIRFHDIRHTAATLMLKENIHPKVVQERLGHSSISLTLDTYSHVIPSMQEEVAEKIEDLLS